MLSLIVFVLPKAISTPSMLGDDLWLNLSTVFRILLNKFIFSGFASTRKNQL